MRIMPKKDYKAVEKTFQCVDYSFKLKWSFKITNPWQHIATNFWNYK